MSRRSAWAVLAGVLFVIVVTTLVDPFALVVPAIPQCRAGGRLYEMQSGRR